MCLSSQPVATVSENSFGTWIWTQPARKEWAESVLASEGVPTNPHLPCIQSIAETTLRTTEEISERLRALIVVANKGAGLEQEVVDQWVEGWNARPFLSPKELKFIEDTAPSEQDLISFSWRYEAAWVMLWALGHVEGRLGAPREICDVHTLLTTIRDCCKMEGKGVGSLNQVLVKADLIYRYHWAVRQARISGAPAPAGLNPSVTMERHQALNWLISWDDSSWDDVPTHT